jgi:hypothetical protein
MLWLCIYRKTAAVTDGSANSLLQQDKEAGGTYLSLPYCSSNHVVMLVLLGCYSSYPEK